MMYIMYDPRSTNHMMDAVLCKEHLQALQNKNPKLAAYYEITESTRWKTCDECVQNVAEQF